FVVAVGACPVARVEKIPDQLERHDEVLRHRRSAARWDLAYIVRAASDAEPRIPAASPSAASTIWQAAPDGALTSSWYRESTRFLSSSAPHSTPPPKMTRPGLRSVTALATTRPKSGAISSHRAVA